MVQVSTVDAKTGNRETSKIYRNNDQERIETNVGPVKTILIVRLDDKKAICLWPDQQRCSTNLVVKDYIEPFIDQSLRLTNGLGGDYTSVGKELLDKHSCQKYRIHLDYQKTPNPLPDEDVGFSWVDRTTRLPVRIKTTKLVSTVKLITLDTPDPTLFSVAIPPGYQN